MKHIVIAVLVSIGFATVAAAGTIEYDNSNEGGNSYWLHAPNSTGGSAVYVDGAETSTSFFGDAGLIGTADIGTGGNVGWLFGSFVYTTAPTPFSDTVYAVVTYDSGTYAGYTYTLPSQGVSFPIGSESVQYDTGGTPIDGSGWVVPEPGTWALFGLGFLTLVGARLRRR
jgi:hypothetical protein